ncbi:MAG: intradiol ring-cleavage dioxygenase [Chloroflexota bacterium]
MNPTNQHDDDKPVGHVLTRREVLTLLGGAGAAALVGTGFSRLGLTQLAGTSTPSPLAESTESVPACIVQPALTEGPYFVDQMLNRSDIRVEPLDGSISEGIQLRLVFRVSQIGAACTPLEGAQVDVWHCDALGIYSDVKDMNARFDTSGKTFLRGYQLTDETGKAEFITIYPGWYQGRTPHIHFKIRTDPASHQGYEFTSQLFFDDDFSDKIYAQEPYSAKTGRRTRNDSDGIFRDGGDQLTLQLVAAEKEEDGYVATFDIGLNTSESTPKSA